MMRTYILPASLMSLLIGLSGGAALTYYWLDRQHIGDPRERQVAIGNDEHGSDREHAEHSEEGGHAERDGKDEHSEHEDKRVVLSVEALQEFGVEVAVAAGGRLERTLKVPGEIALNADRVAHIVPRVAGMVREVCKNVGDTVKAGDLMAVLESRELAEAKAADLAAEARLTLAENNFKRVQELLAKKISPEQEFHEARQKLEEARIAHRETVAKLHALGLDHDQVNKVSNEQEADFSRYEIRAPFAATVVEKHITLGEVHDSSSDVFSIADLSTVWVDLTVYPQDSGLVRPGARLRVKAAGSGDGPVSAEGTIFYVSPIIREATRTGLARAAIKNDTGFWKPGLFVTGEIAVSQDEAAVVVPNEAIQSIERASVVFVVEEDGFEKRSVVVGKTNDSFSEIVSGLKPGDRYVTKGAYILKAELSKGAGGHEH